MFQSPRKSKRSGIDNGESESLYFGAGRAVNRAELTKVKVSSFALHPKYGAPSTGSALKKFSVRGVGRVMVDNTAFRKGQFVRFASAQVVGPEAELSSACLEALSRSEFNGFSLTELSYILTTPLLAFQLLMQLRKLQFDSWIIQNAPLSPLGRQVLRFSKTMGLRSVTLAWGAEQKAEVLDLGGDIVVDCARVTFEERLRELCWLKRPELCILDSQCESSIQLERLLRPSDCFVVLPRELNSQLIDFAATLPLHNQRLIATKLDMGVDVAAIKTPIDFFRLNPRLVRKTIDFKKMHITRLERFSLERVVNCSRDSNNQCLVVEF